MTLNELLQAGAIWKYFGMDLIIESADGFVLYYSGASLGRVVPKKLMEYKVIRFGAMDSLKCVIVIDVKSGSLYHDGNEFVTATELMTDYCERSMACEFGDHDFGFRYYVRNRIEDETLWNARTAPQIGGSTYSMSEDYIDCIFAVPTAWAEDWYKQNKLRFGNQNPDVIRKMEKDADSDCALLSKHYSVLGSNEV